MKKKKETGKIRNWFLNHSSFFIGSFCLLVLVAVSLSVTLLNEKPAEKTLEFSKESGLYDSDIEVSLSGKDSILYTLGAGKIEDVGEPYMEPIRLTVPESGYKAYAITAMGCDGETGCDEKVTKMYLLGKNVYDDVGIDVVKIMVTEEDLYDYERGILVPGKRYDENWEEGKIHVPGNFSERGPDWMRDAHVVMLDKAGNERINNDVGIIVSGGTSAAMGIKSLKIMSNSEYGYSKIPFDFGDGLRLYNSLRFRSGSQDQLFGNVRSAVISRVANESGFDGCTRTNRALVFLNDDFYGIFDMQQNYSSSFLADKYGLVNPDLVKKFKGSEIRTMESAGIRDLLNKDLSIEKNREALEEKVDMDSYLFYYALQIMWNNTDWPGNNYELWKYDGEGGGSVNKYEDGRYRFLVYDTDMTWYTEGNIEYYPGALGDIFEALMEKVYRGEKSLFRNVVASSYYRDKFIQILRELINGPFETSHVLEIVNEEAARIERQVQIFYGDEDYASWQGWIDLLRKGVSERNATVRADVLRYFGVNL